MKKVVSILFLFGINLSFGQSLLERQAEKTREKIKQRAENRVERGIDKTLDKTEEEIESSVKGEKRNQKKENQSTTTSEDIDSNNESSSPQPNVKSESAKEFKAYSKFDFISGEKVLAFEDFSQDGVGDFPSKWNTNSGGEIVTIDGQHHWFNFTSSGMVYPEFISELPENFTLEMDLMFTEDFANMQRGLMLFFPELQYRNLQYDIHFPTGALAGVEIHPYGHEVGSSSAWINDQSSKEIMSNNIDMSSWKVGQINHLSIWRQKNRLRVYINEKKIWDLPRAFISETTYSFLLGTHVWAGKVYLSNLRLAEGLPDTRNKLLSTGKIVSRGILFDVNSDNIKPESYGALQEIAKTLIGLPDVNVKIIGHTDSDGDDQKNLVLSKNRAQAVKLFLTSEFGISANRMEIEGRGETEPVDSNDSPTGKSNNRRVEFVKL